MWKSTAPAGAGRKQRALTASVATQVVNHGLDPQQVAQVKRLRRLGWGLAGIVRHTGLPEASVAIVIGVALPGRALP